MPDQSTSLLLDFGWQRATRHCRLLAQIDLESLSEVLPPSEPPKHEGVRAAPGPLPTPGEDGEGARNEKAGP